MIDHKYRRFVGALLGAMMGLVYGVVSQTINLVMLPGVLLYQPPLGPVGNILIFLSIGLALGLSTAWLESSVLGLFAGGVVGSLILAVVALSTGQTGAEVLYKKIVAVAVAFCPIAAAFVPLLGLFRWVVNKEEEGHTLASSRWKRILIQTALLLVMGGLGRLSLYPPHGLTVMARMHQMAQAGLQAPDAASLPLALQATRVEGFLEHAQGVFTLQWDNTELSRFAIPRPSLDERNQSVVIARFANDWTLVCLFLTADDPEPRCIHYVPLVIPSE